MRTALLLLACLPFGNTLAVTYQTAGDFVASVFSQPVTAQVLWLTETHQRRATSLLGHPYPALRLRYWQSGKKTAWIIDEIGKERPITMGLVIDEGKLVDVRILTYREPRGGEVRHPFFLDQFRGLRLSPDDGLSGDIDGISGATLSVRAVTNVSRYVLYLDSVIP